MFCKSINYHNTAHRFVITSSAYQGWWLEQRRGHEHAHREIYTTVVAVFCFNLPDYDPVSYRLEGNISCHLENLYSWKVTI